jgi:hypothetical protein
MSGDQLKGYLNILCAIWLMDDPTLFDLDTEMYRLGSMSRIYDDDKWRQMEPLVVEALRDEGVALVVESFRSWHNPYRKPIPRGVRERVLSEDAVCAHCGTAQDLQVDHVLPYTRGGTNDFKNLQPLCRTCNIVKGNRFTG